MVVYTLVSGQQLGYPTKIIRRNVIIILWEEND